MIDLETCPVLSCAILYVLRCSKLMALPSIMDGSMMEEPSKDPPYIHEYGISIHVR